MGKRGLGMSRLRIAGITIVVALAGGAIAAADTVLFDFADGSQGWGAFGPITTDSGVDPDSAIGQGRYHVGDFDLAGWGMVAVSPAVDMSPYTGLRLFARLRDVPGYTPFSGSPDVRFGLGIGDAEWLADATLTDAFGLLESTFDGLTPDGEFATAPITPAELADPNLQIKLVMLKGINAGVGELDYDQVTGLGGPGNSQVLPGTVIYDFDSIVNTCYPDHWTFFGVSQTDFGLDGDAEDGAGAYQAADWDLCDITIGGPGCQWAGCGIGLGEFSHPQCTPGGVSDAALDLSLGTGLTIRIKNYLADPPFSEPGARVQLQMTDADGTNAVSPRNVSITPAVNRNAYLLPDEWVTYTFYFDGLDSSWDIDDAVSGGVPGLDLANITAVKLIWRRSGAFGINVFEFDEITLIDSAPQPWADDNGDGDIDLGDLAKFQTCFDVAGATECTAFDSNTDEFVDFGDWTVLNDILLGVDVDSGFYPWAY